MRAHGIRRFTLIVCAGFLATTSARETSGQVEPQTRAEATGYRETSRYEDVIGFVEALEAAGAPVSMRYIGTSPQGRRIPLVIASRPLPANRQEARRQNKPIVCIPIAGRFSLPRSERIALRAVTKLGITP